MTPPPEHPAAAGETFDALPPDLHEAFTIVLAAVTRATAADPMGTGRKKLQARATLRLVAKKVSA